MYCIVRMSHDFFTFYILCIEYKQDGEIQKTYFKLDETKEGHNWNREIYEEEDEETKEFLKQTQLADTLEHYRPEILYHNDTWSRHCMLHISKYVHIIRNLKQINMDCVTHIWKMPEYVIYR